MSRDRMSARWGEDRGRVERLVVAVIAVVAWLGLGLNVQVSLARHGSALASVWALLRFFTITTNLAVAVVFTGLAARRPAFFRPVLIAALALSILLVGIIYRLLLEGLHSLSGNAEIADILLHRVTPILVPLFWLCFVPKGRLRFSDPLIWTLYPLGYFAYALGRGAGDGFYPYPFMDLAAIGWGRTLVNAVVIGLGFLAVAFAVVGLDRLMDRRRPPWSGA